MIAIMPCLVRTSVGESNTLGEDNTVRGVRRTVAENRSASEEVLPADVAVDVAHALEDIERRVVVLLSDLFILLLL